MQVAVEVDDLARQLPIAPQAVTGAIGIKQVRQGLEFAPLFLVAAILRLFTEITTAPAASPTALVLSVEASSTTKIS